VLCEVLVWALAAGITVFIYLAVSAARSEILVRAAFRASVPVMWLVPSVLLLSAGTTVSTMAGLLLVASTVRAVIARSVPQESATPDPPEVRKTRTRMFGSAYLRPPGIRERFPPVTGAILLQIAIWAALAQYPFPAAALVAICAIILTWASKSRGALKSDRRRRLRSSLIVLLTLLFTTALSLSQLPPLHDLTDLVAPPAPPVAKETAMPIFTSPAPVGKEVQGVILHAGPREARPRRKVFGGPLLPAIPVSASEPLTIPFTGEYHLFRTSSGRLPAGSITENGTPLDTLYATTNREPLQMEAYQELSPPLDMKNCEKIQMLIASRDTLPGVAVLQFLNGDKVEDAGIALIGLGGDGEETVTFKIPPNSATRFLVSAIRIVFQSNPTHSERNSRIAIRRLSFAPSHPRGSMAPKLHCNSGETPMRISHIILVLFVAIGLVSCNREDGREGPDAREAGRKAYRAAQSAKRDLKDAERELRNAGRQFREGWEEAKRGDRTRNDK
jgi:hypothetical protein